MPYTDMREYIGALEREGLLRRVTVEVDKDWEIAAVTKRVFQRLPEERRPGVLFERVKGFSIPVVVGILGSSPEVYAMALECTPHEFHIKWRNAFSNPMPPRAVTTGPCKEHVLQGENADLRSFPIPYWTVGQDPSPYITAAQVISVDPQTSQTNVGTYRLQVKGPRTTGLFVAPNHDMARHVERNDVAGKDTPVAIVLGSEPCCALTAASLVPADLDEYAVAGSLRGKPIEVVRCETNELMVPAHAEIVIEGIVPAGRREFEGPFGEYTGYMGPSGESYVVEITCITHRADPIYQCFVSEMPPSESSTIRGAGRAAAIYEHLTSSGYPVTDVYLPHEGGAAAWLVISIQRGAKVEARDLAEKIGTVDATLGKLTVITDDDVNIRDRFEMNWTLAFGVQPERDCEFITDVPGINLDPSLADPNLPHKDRFKTRSSKLLIDARKKHEYPAKSLPPAEHFAEVDRRWKSYGLP